MYEISLFSGVECQICGKELGYLDPKYKMYYKGNPEKSNSYLLFKPHKHSGERRKRCFDCFVEQFGRLPGRQNVNSEDIDWLLQIDTSEQRKQKAPTLENMVGKYGSEEGVARWESYCEKQAIKNTFEFKKDKYGWTEEQFKEYNKGRAVTLENMISRYGIEDGTMKFQEYCSKQAYVGCSLEYFQNKYGETTGKEVYDNICKQKTHNLENFVRRYGVEEGERKWLEYVENKPTTFFSKLSMEMFEELENQLSTEVYDCRYGEREYGIYDKVHDRYYKYDFCLHEQKKIIEFNGCYWHADPRIYQSSDVISFPGSSKRYASDIWLRDDLKHQCAKRMGFDVFVVWESDFHQNREGVIQECLKFIKS